MLIEWAGMIESLQALGGVFEGGRLLHFGDPVAEVRAARESAAVTLIDRSRIVVRGRDRVDFLHNLTTNDIKRLRPGAEGCHAAMVTRTGKLLATLTVRPHENEILLDTDRPGPLLDAFRKYAVIEDVEFEDVTERTRLIGVYGPKARSLLDLPELPPWGLQGNALRVPRILPDAYELWLEADDHTFDRLVRAGAHPLGLLALNTLEIEAGVPRWGIELTEEIVPVEAGLESVAISYTKGCYIGYEVLQRIKTYSEPKKVLRGLRLSAKPLPRRGEAILRDGKTAGWITRSVESPTLGAPIALGYLQKGHHAPGTRVVVAGTPAVVVALPFVQ